MPNVESLEQHNVNYVKDDAFEREKKAHQEHNSDNFKFLYQEDIPHGDALDKYELTSGVDIGIWYRMVCKLFGGAKKI